MLDLVVRYWVWIISALVASGPAGYWSTRPQVARDRGLPGSQGWAALIFAIGLVVAILLPGQAGLYFDALLFLSFLCIAGFLSGAWLRRARTRTRTQVATPPAVEDGRRAIEVKGAEHTSRIAEARAAEDARRAADAKAAEDARRIAEARAAEDAHRVAEVNAAEDARRTAGEDARRAADAKAAEDARRTAEARAAENARRAEEIKAAEDAGRVAKKAKAAEKARSAAATHPRKRPDGMAAPPSGKPDNNLRLIKGKGLKPRARAASQKRTPAGP